MLKRCLGEVAKRVKLLKSLSAPSSERDIELRNQESINVLS